MKQRANIVLLILIFTFPLVSQEAGPGNPPANPEGPPLPVEVENGQEEGGEELPPEKAPPLPETHEPLEEEPLEEATETIDANLDPLEDEETLVIQEVETFSEGSFEAYLDRLINLEEGTQWDSGSDLPAIQLLIEDLAETPYLDLEAEAAFMEYLLIQKTEEDERLASLEAFTENLMKAAEEEKRDERRVKSRKFWTGATLTTAVVSLVGVTYLKTLGDSAYESYLVSDDAQEQRFYQGLWRTWDLSTAITAGVSLLSFSTFVILFGSGN